ncbi:class I SAM-dependent RNA methyltransferase [Methylocystis sp. Sn-Cys]|uniref:class I SAM-dependent RNA methyltransferase n=1 Tax=Methylocystis sp. Sn-Cys TaxID=1701263 RepID=UPI001923777F|nr:methyltransferase [Methylocystis sp. Sn-Cys]MBL1258517.1 class I SAM-dependent RNA methyltransferase [Methylocystis sp. Sn-Cys]
MKNLYIERLGLRGEGVARDGDARVFVPYALPGETVVAEVEGDHARLIEVIDPSPDRIAPFCPHYAHCGGCAVQALAPAAYAEWKRGLVVTALRNAGLSCEVAPLVDAHGAGRRRVTFHARMEKGHARVGFMAARSHETVEIEGCPLLVPELAGALPAARAIAQILAARGKPLDLSFTATLDGMDVDLRGAGPLEEHETSALIKAAEAHDLARLSNHGRLVALRRSPVVQIGPARVPIPPGCFLQATAAGEEAIATRVLAAAKGAKRVADLFCGVGAFALRLAQSARVSAFDSAADAVEAMFASARNSEGLKPLDGAARDLFERPLSVQELTPFDVVVFDPPRAGAQAQAREIAKSAVKTVVAVSCGAQSFARDAAILLNGGYSLSPVTPIDQFRHAPHVEIVAVFSRRDGQKRAKRALLG